jgi:hypothetical protein
VKRSWLEYSKLRRTSCIRLIIRYPPFKTIIPQAKKKIVPDDLKWVVKSLQDSTKRWIERDMTRAKVGSCRTTFLDRSLD